MKPELNASDLTKIIIINSSQQNRGFFTKKEKGKKKAHNKD